MLCTPIYPSLLDYWVFFYQSRFFSLEFRQEGNEITERHNWLLCYGGWDLWLHGSTDADYARNLDEHISTSTTFLLQGGTTSWCSKKQSIVVLSTMKTDYVTASSTTQEAIWLRWFLLDLEVAPHASDLITLYCDCRAMIGHTTNARYLAKSNHIDVKFNPFMNWSEEATLEYIPTSAWLLIHLPSY